MISAVVLTYNEENILYRCLNALSFVDEIIVFDSFSTDATLSIARSMGAHVIQRKFDNYANQRNAALASVNPNSSWILMVDADEIVEENLRIEIETIVKSESKNTLYVVRRKDYFLGKWLRYAGFYPTWIPRLFRAGEVRVQRSINEEYVTNGPIGTLSNHLVHYPFNKGVQFWYEKHLRYAQMEAQLLFEDSPGLVPMMRNLFSKSKLERRKGIKKLSFYIPLRWLFIWIYLFIFKLGFLDGKRGLLFISMRVTYEKMIVDIKKSFVYREND